MAVVEVEYRGAALRLFGYRGGEVLMSGPAGTGKSRACLQKLFIAAVKYPGMRGLVVRKAAATLRTTALVTWTEQIIPPLLAQGGIDYYGGSAQEPAQYRFYNGSTVVIGGLDKASKIMSSEYDLVFVQEAIELTEDDWEKVTTRLRHGVMPYQQLIGDTNPDAEFHWLNQRCQNGLTRMLYSRHADNPLYFNADGSRTAIGEAYMAKLEALTGVRRARLLEGRWVAAEGVVYDQWDPAVHLVDSAPDGGELFMTVDFGYGHPFVAQWWRDTGTALYLVAEIHMTGRTVTEHARTIAETCCPGYVRDGWREDMIGRALRRAGHRPEFLVPEALYCDHDADGRQTLSDCLGIAAKRADKRVLEGIDAVQRRLADKALFVVRDSLVEIDREARAAGKPVRCADEFASYVWKEQRPGTPKDAPLKENDDSMDALRYAVASRDLRHRPNVRWI